VRLDDKYAVITFVSDHATGVKRARALVHGRSVAALFKENHLAITISSPAELTERHVRAQRASTCRKSYCRTTRIVQSSREQFK